MPPENTSVLIRRTDGGWWVHAEFFVDQQHAVVRWQLLTIWPDEQQVLPLTLHSISPGAAGAADQNDEMLMKLGIRQTVDRDSFTTLGEKIPGSLSSDLAAPSDEEFRA